MLECLLKKTCCCVSVKALRECSLWRKEAPDLKTQVLPAAVIPKLSCKLFNCRYYCAVSDFFLYFLFFQQFTLSKCIDAVMVLGNSHLFMNRTNKLAVIASHTQERYRCFLPVLKFNGGFSIYIS